MFSRMVRRSIASLICLFLPIVSNEFFWSMHQFIGISPVLFPIAQKYLSAESLFYPFNLLILQKNRPKIPSQFLVIGYLCSIRHLGPEKLYIPISLVDTVHLNSKIFFQTGFHGDWKDRYMMFHSKSVFPVFARLSFAR